MPDTKALKIGNTEGTPDFTISHDTSNTILDNNTGDLILRGDGDDVKILPEDDIVLEIMMIALIFYIVLMVIL